MKKVLSVENMKKSDKNTISEGIKGTELMFRAGKGIFESVEWTRSVAIVCGRGNNAGDGYVLAILLQENNIYTKLFLISENFSIEGKYYFDICKERGIPYEIIDSQTSFSSFSIIVDCIFGTGYKGNLEKKERFAIQEINNSNAYVVSVDINSGLNGDNGMADMCVISDLTISIGGYKPGHFLNMAKDKIKKLINVDIGINPVDNPYYLLEASDVIKAFKVRPNFSNKYTFGSSCLLGGSKEYSGAIKLANLATGALKAGGGITTLALPNTLIPSVLPYVLESTVCPLSDKDGELVFNSLEIDKLLEKVDVIAYGMGLGLGEGNLQTLSYILSSNFPGTVIIDADGINALSRIGTDYLVFSKMPVIITPHVGEFSRLLKKSKEEILNDPIGLAKEFAAKYRTIVLLKGPTTIVTDGKDVILVDKGCPGMATAGSGDVLSGILAGMCSFNKDNLLLTVASSAYVNGLAGEIAQKRSNVFSMTAKDTIDSIKDAINLIIMKDNVM
jgi:NAD(P)H-hydrate epimerase